MGSYRDDMECASRCDGFTLAEGGGEMSSERPEPCPLCGGPGERMVRPRPHEPVVACDGNRECPLMGVLLTETVWQALPRPCIHCHGTGWIADRDGGDRCHCPAGESLGECYGENHRPRKERDAMAERVLELVVLMRAYLAGWADRLEGVVGGDGTR